MQIGTDVLVNAEEEVIGGTVVGEQDRTFYVDYATRETAQLPFFVHQYRASSNADKANEEKGATRWVSSGSTKAFCIAHGDGNHDELRAIPADRIRRDPSWILPFIKRNRTVELPIFPNRHAFQVSKSVSLTVNGTSQAKFD